MKLRRVYSYLNHKGFPVRKEAGFTLVEVIVVVVIVAILTAIAIPIFMGQQRAAIASTVQADVSHNKSVMPHGGDGKFYKLPESFLAQSATSPGNITYYTVSPDNARACTHTFHQFGDGDVVAFRMRSEHGKIEEGLCDPYGGPEAVQSGDPEDEEEGPVPSHPTVPEDEDEEVTAEEPGGDYTHPAEGGGLYPIYPANGDTVLDIDLVLNETGLACFVVDISTTSESGVPWAFKVDKTVSPFLNNFIPSDGGDGRFVREDRGDHYYVYGTAALRDASTTVKRTYGAGLSFCAQSPHGQPIERPAVSTSIEPIAAPTGDQWYATQRFKISNNSLYHSSWTTQVDLTDLLNRMGRTPANARFAVQTAGDMKIEHLSGNIYRVYNDNNGYWAIHKDKTLDIIIQGGAG